MLRRILKSLLRTLIKPALGAGVPLRLQRGWLKAVAAGMPAPSGTKRLPTMMQGVHAECISTPNPRQDRIILYLHGGGYCVGSAYACRVITGRLAHLTGAVVYAPDYRLAPENPHPAALEDGLASYRWLLAQGHAATRISLAGDSAGGGLALSTAIAIRAAGLPAPAALALISPWVDLGCNNRSFDTHSHRDPLLSTALLRRWASAYLGSRPSSDPACSPLYADLAGLPPLLIQVGSEEILLDDSRQLQQRALAAGTPARLHEYEGMWHDFQLHAGVLQESDSALSEISDFLSQHWTP